MNGHPVRHTIRETADPSTLKNWLTNKHRHLGLGLELPVTGGSPTPEDQWRIDKEWWERATLLLPSDHSFMPAEWVKMVRGLELPLSPAKVVLLQQGAALAQHWKPNEPNTDEHPSNRDAQHKELLDIITKIAEVTASEATKKPNYLTWSTCLILAAWVIPGLIGATQHSGQAAFLLRGWVLSAGVLAVIAAFVRMRAHDRDKDLDLFGKMLGFGASCSALWAAVALAFLRFN